MVDPKGFGLDPAARWVAKEHLDEIGGFNPEMAHLAIEEGIRAHAKKHPRVRVTVFVHGGLNSFQSSLDTYRSVLAELQNPQSPTYDPAIFPIFIVWKSGLKSSYGEHLWSIRQGESHPVLAPVTSPLVFCADLLGGLVRAPVIWIRQGYNDWRTTELVKGEQWAEHNLVEDHLLANAPHTARVNADKMLRDRRSRPERAWYLFSYVVTLPVKLFASPMIDGFGSKAWDNMLRRTNTMFYQPVETDIFLELKKQRGRPEAQQKAVEAWFGNFQPGATLRFARHLRDWSRDASLQADIELYGHSMGAIVLNHLLREVPDIRVKRIAYLAPACSISDWQKSVLPYLNSRDGAGAEFYSLALHRMREASERNPGKYADLAPRGSLLNWIDNYFSHPTNIEERTLGSWDNVARIVPQIPTQLRERVHLLSFDAVNTDHPDYRTLQPQKHGDLDDWPFWSLAMLWPTSHDQIPRRFKD
jgi:hypothetical protein